MPQIEGSFVWKVSHYQSKSGGQQVLNVYHYHFPDLPLAPDALGVANAFDSQIVPLVAACQSVTVEHVRIDVELLGSLTDYASIITTTAQGTQVGESLPIFNALRYDLIRSTKETRSGSKRFAGLVEDWVSGDFLTATGDTERLALAAGLESDLTVGIFTVTPVILGIRYVPNSDPREELPVAQWIYNPIAQVQVNLTVTTQNTRKRGVGA